MKTHSLKFLRIVAAILSIVAITLVFIDVTGWCASKLSFLTNLQLIPALLSFNILIIALLAVLTLIFGRLYCSVICPLGVTQDVIAWLRRRFAKRTKRKVGIYRFKAENKVTRYAILILFLGLVVAGLFTSMSFAGLLDPYSAYGRIVSQTIAPAWRSCAATYGEHLAATGNYVFDAAPPTAGYLSIPIAIVAAVSFVTIFIFAALTGRGYCNTICPAGTILGFLSRYSLLRPVIDIQKCNKCGTCGRHCKSQCIDTKTHSIDYSRCVVCMNCINSCKQSAISYRRNNKANKAITTETIDGSRRNFLMGTAIVAGTAAASATEKIVDGGFSALKSKQSHKTGTLVIPPGARSLRHFRGHCTACQLCISQCPSHILQPGTEFDGFMQPKMIFTNGFCRPECTRCSNVCPAGAITPIDVATKSSIKIGTAHIDANICISAANGESCGNCSRHCPVNAISMVETESGTMRPVVNENACIGCGACEYHCPVGIVAQFESDTAAIYVEGLKQHQTI